MGCIKCSNSEVVFKAFGTSNNGIGTMFEREQKEFTAVSCTDCGYTEFYIHKLDNEEEMKSLFFKR